MRHWTSLVSEEVDYYSQNNWSLLYLEVILNQNLDYLKVLPSALLVLIYPLLM